MIFHTVLIRYFETHPQKPPPQWAAGLTINLENYVKRILAVSVGLSLSLMLAACSNKVAMNDCVDRGMEYHKEVGDRTMVSAHPNTGRRVVDVVQERCIRSVTAY